MSDRSDIDDRETVADLSDTVGDSDSGDHIDQGIAGVSGAPAALAAIAVDVQFLAVCQSNLAGVASPAGGANLDSGPGLYAASPGPVGANLDPDSPDAGGSATTGPDVDSWDPAMARTCANRASLFVVAGDFSTTGLDDRFAALVMDDKLDSIDRSDLAPGSDSVGRGLPLDNTAPDLPCVEVALAA